MNTGPGIHRTPLPQGFYASGINSGVRKYRPDLGVILSDHDCTAAGVFTQNECLAAPVLYSKAILPSRKIRAVITNSGQANAATGNEGIKLNLQMAEALAQKLNCETHQVITASTGVIGVPLQIEKIIAGIDDLVERAVETAEPFALAILTTDLVPKTVSTEVELSGGTVRISGIAKGSGMIHPNMATMLGYLLTDAVLAPEMAQKLVKDVSDVSFNMISVDGDTSTNDSVFLMANGATGVELRTPQDFAVFAVALEKIAICLAKAITRDGEGATKLIEVRLKGASDRTLARRAARGVTISPLIKSAIHGEDPNWGRILGRLGAERIPAEQLAKMTLDIQGVRVFAAGGPTGFDVQDLRRRLKSENVIIEIDFQSGPIVVTAWGCDLSKKYVEINTEYTT